MVLNEARDKWYFIGEGLGLGTADLNEIQAQHHSDKAMCLHKVLQHRIQRGRLTRSTLCKSLRGQLVQRDDVAQNIEALPLNTFVSALSRVLIYCRDIIIIVYISCLNSYHA